MTKRADITQALKQFINRWVPKTRRDSSRTQFEPSAEQREITSALLRGAKKLLDSRDVKDMLQEYIDDLTTATPNIVLAWAWFGDPNTKEITPQVAAGAAVGYANQLTIARSYLTEKGPAFQALSGKTPSPYSINALSLYGPWREAVRSFDIRSVLALPLSSPTDSRRGVLVLYACQERYFERTGVKLFEAFSELVSSILSRNAEHDEALLAAQRDKLTGLENRHGEAALALSVQRRDATSQETSVALLDIDHFKIVNDTYGHDAGDVVLRNVASVIRRNLRYDDTVLRWGGEEFLIGLPGAGADDARRVLGAMQDELRHYAHALPDGRHLRVTASIGIASLQPEEALSAAITRADGALYVAKNEGRDRISLAAVPTALHLVVPSKQQA